MAREGQTPFIRRTCARKDWEIGMGVTQGLGVDIVPACDASGQPMEKNLSRDFEAITRRAQIYRTAYLALDMIAREDLLETVAYLVLYLKYVNPNSREFARVNIQAEITDNIGPNGSYLDSFRDYC